MEVGTWKMFENGRNNGIRDYWFQDYFMVIFGFSVLFFYFIELGNKQTVLLGFRSQAHLVPNGGGVWSEEFEENNQ